MKYILATLIYIAVISYLLLRPYKDEHTGIWRVIFYNFLHIPIYGLLAYFVFRCFRSRAALTYAVTFIIATGYGMTIEFLQSSVPGRYASLMDIFLNTIGIAISLGLVYRVRAMRKVGGSE